MPPPTDAPRDSKVCLEKGPTGWAIGAGTGVEGVGWLQTFHEHFELGKKLGNGAFAVVHIARQVRSSHTHAVKIMRLTSNCDFDGKIDTRRCQHVWREVEMLQRMRGETHVVQIENVSFERGLSYLVMERCTSTLLNSLERLSDYNEVTVRPFFRDMLRGLAALHQARIVHRDVKPDNFLCFGPEAIVKLCDFGFASVLSSSSAEYGLNGVYGTPPYMAPEMVRGLRYDMRSDVWSLGVVAYVLLFGSFPYMPQQHTSSAMKVAIASGKPPPIFRHSRSLQETGLHLSSAADAFLHGALCRRPHDRLTASAALNNAYFAIDSSGVDSAYVPSLRRALHAAKRVGAFDPPFKPASFPTSALTALSIQAPLDVRLAELQAASHARRNSHTASLGTVAPAIKDIGAKRQLRQLTLSIDDLDTDAGESLGSTTCASGLSPVDLAAF